MVLTHYSEEPKMVEKMTVKQIDAKIRQLRKQIREIKEQEAKSVE